MPAGGRLPEANGIFMKNLFQILFAASALLLVASYFQKDKLPDSAEMLEQLKFDPVQSEMNAAPFDIQKKDVTFTVTPLFAYELSGLVVSYHHSDDLSDFSHKKWGDSLNIEDLCVIWGPNVEGNLYKKINFSSGNWTCFYQTRDQETWENFKPEFFSNNHLLTDNPALASKILSARKGDQIRLMGYLVNYTHNKGFFRNTSTTRKDTGQGACEIIFVTDFQILKRANMLWRMIFTASKILTPAFLILLFAAFMLDTRTGNANVRL